MPNTFNTEIIDGKSIAREVRLAVKDKTGELRLKTGNVPRLVSIIVGDEKDAQLYVNAQKKIAGEVGIDFRVCHLEKRITQGEFLDIIEELNSDDDTTAVIVQHPLPEGLDHNRIVAALKAEKDAEGIHPANLGRIFRREAEIVPCTPGAVMKILSSKGINLYGKDVVIIGHSAIVGKPLSMMVLNETATTSVCHIGTAEKGDIKRFTRSADIIVVAVGKPGMVTRDWIKEGAVLIDVGINTVDGKIVGDIDIAGVMGKASMVTPVPGGVGPITVSILMRNVVRAYAIQYEKIQG